MAAARPKKPLPSGKPYSPPIRHLIKLDAGVSRRLHGVFHPYLPASILLVLELSADFRLFFPLALAAAFSPISLPLLPLLSPLILGLLLDLAVVGALKLLIRRRRPPYNPNMSPAVSADHFSFPSGHASRVFFVASLVSLSSASVRAALGAGENPRLWTAAGDEEKAAEVVVAVVFAWAAVTASSRVFLGRHYLLDVVAGSGLGVLEGILAFQYLHFEEYFLKLFTMLPGGWSWR